MDRNIRLTFGSACIDPHLGDAVRGHLKLNGCMGLVRAGCAIHHQNLEAGPLWAVNQINLMWASLPGERLREGHEHESDTQ